MALKIEGVVDGGVDAEKTLGADSLVEGRVTSEPVSEVGFFGPGELRPDSKPFMDDTGSVRAPFRARISRNFGFVPRPTSPAISS